MAKARRFSRLRTVAFSAAAAFLVWEVVSQSFAAYLADSAPETALWLHPGNPAALINLADQALNTVANTVGTGTAAADETSDHTASTAGSMQQGAGNTVKPIVDYAFSEFETIEQNQSITRPIAPDNAPAVRVWAETALTNEPLSAHALRILGQLAEAEGADENAVKFMEAAARLSLHESVANFWLMQKSAQATDDTATIYYADVLLRTTEGLERYVVPILAHIAEEKRLSNLLSTMLAGNPPWRKQFFVALPNGVTDARTPLGLLMSLRASAAPPSSAEVGSYINFLIAHKFYDLAYYTWLQFLPPEELRSAGLLFNGSFEVAPSGLPFDWQIRSGAGVTVDIVPRADKAGQHGLLVDFQYGRVDYRSVTQLVMLAPGNYEFKGEYKGQLDGPRGLKWRIACAGEDGAILGESPMIIGLMPTWRPVEFTFAVPTKDCKAQYVRLDLDARMASEQLISGSMLFDELQISRVANPS